MITTIEPYKTTTLKESVREYVDVQWEHPEELINAISQIQELVQYLLEKDAT